MRLQSSCYVSDSRFQKYNGRRCCRDNAGRVPVEITDKLNKEIDAGLTDPKIEAAVADMGGTALTGSPADFRKLIADETEKWAKVVKFADIKPD
jgi:tripartite-type tricarboxylate transporter receptor subunit TctC